MKPIVFGFCTIFLFCACKKEEQTISEKSDSFKEIKSGSYNDSDFSPWMTKAEQQVAHEAKAPGQYYAYVEGRNNGGLNQYRHVQRAFPGDQYELWSVYWGLSTEEFYQVELKMLRAGYSRENLQVFVDSNGNAMHQAVWLKAK